MHGTGTDVPILNIPYVVEAWAEPLDDAEESELSIYINRTPVTGDFSVSRDKKRINFFGCGLRSFVAETTKNAQFDITLNIITPFMPITSDGKPPTSGRFSMR